VQVDLSPPGSLSQASAQQAFWIYALPGSRLGLTRSAGAPSLASLLEARDEPLAHRVWIFYGSPDDALLDLAGEACSQEGACQCLSAWQEAMHRAVQAKRRWRERLQLINLAYTSPEQAALL